MRPRPLTERQRAAGALWELSRLLRLTSRRRSFPAAAYRRAVPALDLLPGPPGELPLGALTTVPRIGAGIAAVLTELAETGTIRRLDELRERLPPGEADLREVARLGDRQVAALADAGVRDLAGLAAAVTDGTLDQVAGFGPAKRRWLARRLAALDPAGGIPRWQAVPLARHVQRRVEAAAERCDVAGAVRRFDDMVPGVELVAAAHPPEPAVEAFATSALFGSVAVGPGRAAGLDHGGTTATLTVVPPGKYGTALVEATGSRAHLAALGPLPDRPDEADVYAGLGLPSLPPEIRQGTGEVPAARAGTLPALVTAADLRGDLHLHTELSRDGHQSLDQLCDAAVARGYEYVAITDHAENLRVSGVGRDRMLAQRRAIERLRAGYPTLRILHGAELNIGPDGGLDYDAEFLAGYDWTVASVHSHFDADRDAQTRRLVAAIRHPAVTCIGHLTGRRLGHRPGIEFDPRTVLGEAAAARVALEVNGHADRLDLPAGLVRQALDAGAVLALNSDAHRLRELDNVANASLVARKGWATAEEVVNAWPVDRFLAWLRDGR